MMWPRTIAEHIERLVAAEAAALEAACQEAWALTRPDRRDRLQIVAHVGPNPPPRTVACMTDLGWQHHQARLLLLEYEANHGVITDDELRALEDQWLT